MSCPRLPQGDSKMTNDELTKHFTKFMLNRNVKQAVPLLEKDASKSVLQLNEHTLKELRDKHPPGGLKHDEMIIEGRIEKVNYVIFKTILKTAVTTKGSTGPSLYYAGNWRNIFVQIHSEQKLMI